MKNRVYLPIILLAILCIALGIPAATRVHAASQNASTESQVTESTEAAESTQSTETEIPEKKKNNRNYSGLHKIDGDIYYYVKGKPFCGGLKAVKIKDNKFYYYFRKNGRALTNSWKKIDSKKYYFGESGKAYTGTKTVSHYLCHFDKKGVLYRKIDKDKKMVALTYDDGPSVYTPKILKTLEENNAVATFFVVGCRTSYYKEHIKTAYKMHCEIGNHSYNHPILTKVGVAKIESEITSTNEAIKNIIGVDPIVMRPPGGAVNSNVRKYSNMPLIIWSLDTLDWKTRKAASTETAVLERIKDGDIVLMHDLYDPTANASQKIIPELVNRGYQLVTVSELAACRGQKLKSGQSYFSFR